MLHSGKRAGMKGVYMVKYVRFYYVRTKMRLWKVLLVLLSVAILPFALVGVGQAQQMNCWGLAPRQVERKEKSDNSKKAPPQNREIFRNTLTAVVALIKAKNIS